MTKAEQHFFLEIVAEQGLEAEALSDYSGRGMYGKTTEAVVIQGCDAMMAGFLMGVMVERVGMSLQIPFRTDNMGRDGTVVY